MKSSIKFAIAALALGMVVNASAGVIIQSQTQVSKKRVLVQYRQDPTGVLHTMTIRHRKLAKWCIKHGGCRNNPPAAVGNGQILVIAGVVDTGSNGSNGTSENGSTGTVPDREVVAVPEPATLALLGAGLLGMGLSARRRKSDRAG